MTSQICQFCYNNIKTHSEEGRCPNCRRPYDDSTIQYKIPDAEELVINNLPPLRLDRQAFERLTHSFYDIDSKPTWH